MLKQLIRIVFYLAVAIGCLSAFAGSYEDYFRAIENDDAGTVRGLLDRGFDPNAHDERGQVGLFLAFRAGSTKVAEVLFTHPQLEVDAPNTLNETPLMMAALRGQLEWCSRLVERGAKIRREGWTPLHYAATGPHPKVVEFLLKRGAEVDALAPDQSTPLMMAAMYGSEVSIDLLLARGASAGRRNARGQRAADLARSVGRDALAQRLERSAH
jgi:uncharacterized protein